MQFVPLNAQISSSAPGTPSIQLLPASCLQQGWELSQGSTGNYPPLLTQGSTSRAVPALHPTCWTCEFPTGGKEAKPRLLVLRHRSLKLVMQFQLHQLRVECHNIPIPVTELF